jgi:hypothetical protein
MIPRQSEEQLMHKRSRLLLWSGLLVALAGAGFAGVVWLTMPAPSRINDATVASIRPGMTGADVERLLGGPPGDYTTRDVYWAMESSRLVPPGTPLSWIGDEGEATVYFDEEGGVTGAFFDYAFSPPKPFLDRLRSWLCL